MPDPKDEQTIMQRFDRLLKAMVQGGLSGKKPAEDQTSSEEPDEGSDDTQTPKDTCEGASSRR
jgi:hypothetical protein